MEGCFDFKWNGEVDWQGRKFCFTKVQQWPLLINANAFFTHQTLNINVPPEWWVAYWFLRTISWWIVPISGVFKTQWFLWCFNKKKWKRYLRELDKKKNPWNSCKKTKVNRKSSFVGVIHAVREVLTKCTNLVFSTLNIILVLIVSENRGELKFYRYVISKKVIINVKTVN